MRGRLLSYFNNSVDPVERFHPHTTQLLLASRETNPLLYFRYSYCLIYYLRHCIRYHRLASGASHPVLRLHAATTTIRHSLSPSFLEILELQDYVKSLSQFPGAIMLTNVFHSHIWSSQRRLFPNFDLEYSNIEGQSNVPQDRKIIKRSGRAEIKASIQQIKQNDS